MNQFAPLQEGRAPLGGLAQTHLNRIMFRAVCESEPCAGTKFNKSIGLNSDHHQLLKNQGAEISE